MFSLRNTSWLVKTYSLPVQVGMRWLTLGYGGLRWFVSSVGAVVFVGGSVGLLPAGRFVYWACRLIWARLVLCFLCLLWQVLRWTCSDTSGTSCSTDAQMSVLVTSVHALVVKLWQRSCWLRGGAGVCCWFDVGSVGRQVLWLLSRVRLLVAAPSYCSQYGEAGRGLIRQKNLKRNRKRERGRNGHK